MHLRFRELHEEHHIYALVAVAHDETDEPDVEEFKVYASISRWMAEAPGVFKDWRSACMTYMAHKMRCEGYEVEKVEFDDEPFEFGDFKGDGSV